MRLSEEKRRAEVEKKSKSIINNSISKALYSFSKAERFPNRRHSSMIDVHFYETRPKMYDRKISFTSAHRINPGNKNQNPSPNLYNPSLPIADSNHICQFKYGRDVPIPPFRNARPMPPSESIRTQAPGSIAPAPSPNTKPYSLRWGGATKPNKPKTATQAPSTPSTQPCSTKTNTSPST
jgi:hypothetical protein